MLQGKSASLDLKRALKMLEDPRKLFCADQQSEKVKNIFFYSKCCITFEKKLNKTEINAIQIFKMKRDLKKFI